MHPEVCNLIENFKAYYAVFGVMQWEHNIPEVQAIVANDLEDPTANIGAYRMDGSRYEIYIPPIIAKSQTPEFNLFYIRMSMFTAIMKIADTIVKLNLMSRASPELQFLKHLRNACAHGNRFYLKSGEPKSPASFRGFEILPSHDGFSPVLFDYIKPGDVFDLFDHVQTMP